MRINRYKYYQPSLNKNASNVLGKRSNQWWCAGILPSANIEINDEIPLTVIYRPTLEKLSSRSDFGPCCFFEPHRILSPSASFDKVCYLAGKNLFCNKTTRNLLAGCLHLTSRKSEDKKIYKDSREEDSKRLVESAEPLLGLPLVSRRWKKRRKR